MEGDSINGWLISSPSTGIISRMDLSKPLPPRPTQQRSTKRFNRVVKASQLPRLQHRSSDISNPGMTDDQGSSGSDGSLEDDYKYYASAEIWDSYWSSTAASQSTSRPLIIPLPKTHHSNLSQENRNFASSDLAGLNPAFPADLHRSYAIPSSQAKQTCHTYCPFPAILPTPPPPKPTHHSWPRRQETRPNRPRAQTTPSKYPARPPSNLSHCTTLDYSSSCSSSTPLYMHCSSLSPLFASSFTDRPPIDFLQTSFTEDEEEEVSHFDYDDDDDEEVEEESESRGEKFKKIFHIRSSSNNNHEDEEGGEGEKVKGKCLRKLRKSLSDVASDANETFRGVFRGKK